MPGEGAEVGRLHRTRTTTGHHDEPGLGQPMAEASRRGIRLLTTSDRMTTHHAHDLPAGEPLVEGVGDRLVVDRAQQGDVDVSGERRVP